MRNRCSGAVCLNNRYHHPTLGSFISVDPLVTATGEAYTYASANPARFWDPSGLCTIDMVLELGCGGGRQGGSPTVVPRTYFDPQPGLGTVRTNLFIAADHVGEPFAGSDGNDRGFSATAGCDVSKVCIIVNFGEGWVSGQFAPTCNGGACVDALPLGDGNTFDVSIDASGGGVIVNVQIDGKNPLAPSVPFLGAPAIDLRFSTGIEVVSRPGSPSLGVESYSEHVFFVAATGDGYPSIESYVDTDVGSITAVQDREGPEHWDPGPWPLYPLHPDRKVRYERQL